MSDHREQFVEKVRELIDADPSDRNAILTLTPEQLADAMIEAAEKEGCMVTVEDLLRSANQADRMAAAYRRAAAKRSS